MKDIFRVFKFEFLKEVKSKSFIISTIFFAVLIIGLSVFMRFMISSELEDEAAKSKTIGIIAEDQIQTDLDLMFDDYIIYGSEEEIRKAIDEELIEYGLVFNEIDDVKVIVYRADTDMLTGGYTNPIKDYLLDQELAKSNLSLASIDQMRKDIEVKQTVEAIQETNFLAMGGAFLSIIVIYIMVLGSGQSVASAITSEKADRTMEILLTSTSPKALIHGKVLASLVTSLIQLLTMGLASLVAVLINMDAFLTNIKDSVPTDVPTDQVDLESAGAMLKGLNLDFDPSILILTFLFFITGYFLYVYIYAALGASVSKTEDLAMAVMPITMVTIAIYVASFTALGNPDGQVMTVLSYIPFSSVFVAVIRYSLSDMTLVQLGLSYIILLITTIVFVKLSVKLYRMTSLNYGNTSFKSQIKALFSKA